jgi:ATP-dependent helicase/nuclease subunit A
MPEPAVPPARKMRFTDAQLAIIEARHPEVWVSAAAGSGKTGCLVERLARQLEQQPEAAPGIVAFTFTRKAAQGMLHRLRRKMSGPQQREAARQVDRLRIGTIDSFCAQVLREHAVDLGLDPRFEALDPVEGDQLERRVALEVLEAAARAGESGVRPWFTRYEAADLARTLIEVGRRLRNAGEPEALLDAWERGPGASFESYARSFGVGPVELQHQALEQVRASVEACIGDESRTPAHRQLLRDALDRLAGSEWDFAAWLQMRKGLPVPRRAGDKERFEELRRPAWEFTSFRQPPWKGIDAAGGVLCDEELWGLIRAFLPLLRGHLAAFAAAKRRMIPPRLDFQDVQLLVLRLARESEAFRDFRDRRLKQLLVDELQDVNGLQSQLIEELGRGTEVFGVGDPMQSIYRFRHADVELFTRRLAPDGAGDKACHGLLENHRSLPGIIEFVNTVFSDLVASGDGGAEGLPFKAVEAKRGNSGAAASPDAAGPAVEALTVLRAPASAGANAHKLSLAEARSVAARLRELHDTGFLVEVEEPGSSGRTPRPVRWGDMAVLFRTRGAVATYAKALAEAGIPVETQHQAELLRSVEGRDLTSLLSVLANPRQDLPLAAVLRSPFVDLADETLLALARAAEARTPPGDTRFPLIEVLRDREVRAGLPAAEMERLEAFLARLEDSRGRVLTEGAPAVLREWLDHTGYLSREAPRRAGEQVAGNLRTFVEQCRALEPSRGDLAGLLERLRHLEDSESGPRENSPGAGGGVQLMTIHAAKGLEFPVVVVAAMGRNWKRRRPEQGGLKVRLDGAERRLQLAASVGATLGDDRSLTGLGRILMAMAEDREDQLEELRLLYVATTRAEDLLILAGTCKATEEGDRKWEDGYGRWVEDALQRQAGRGVDVERLVARTEIEAHMVSAPGVRAAGGPLDAPAAGATDFTSLWDLHGRAIARGEPVPVEDAPELQTRAREILERASTPVPTPELVPRDIGAADMGRALLCPWLHVYRAFLDDVSGNTERGAGTAGGAGSELGTRVHAFFEHWDVSTPPLEDFERAAALAGLTEEDRGLLTGWLAHPEVSAALAELTGPKDRVRRELVFEWSVAGTRISGRLDALVQVARWQWRVVDFKTDKSEQLAEHYDRQTAIYAAAVERAGLGQVVGRRLIYLRLGQVKDLTWGPGDADALESAAAEALRQLGRQEMSASRECEGCAMQKVLGRSCAKG